MTEEGILGYLDPIEQEMYKSGALTTSQVIRLITAKIATPIPSYVKGGVVNRGIAVINDQHGVELAWDGEGRPYEVSTVYPKDNPVQRFFETHGIPAAEAVIRGDEARKAIAGFTQATGMDYDTAEAIVLAQMRNRMSDPKAAIRFKQIAAYQKARAKHHG